jgi:hypothetical protein
LRRFGIISDHDQVTVKGCSSGRRITWYIDIQKNGPTKTIASDTVVGVELELECPLESGEFVKFD